MMSLEGAMEECKDALGHVLIIDDELSKAQYQGIPSEVIAMCKLIITKGGTVLKSRYNHNLTEVTMPGET